MSRISTRNIQALPAPRELARLGQALAMLDAILFPEDWDDRWHSFDARWGRGEQVFSMRDGSGDFYFALFTPAVTILHGFAHEATMSPWSSARSNERSAPTPFPGLFEGMPKAPGYRATAKSFCAEPEEVTFCAWWTGKGPWSIGSVTFPRGKDPDGSDCLLRLLDADPRAYVRWAREYVGEAPPLAAVKQVYALEPLTRQLTAAINPEADFAEVRKEARGIGYPLGR